MALNDALVRFVKDGLERGLPRDRIADALLRAGWPPDQVSTALRSFAEIDFPIPVPRPMPNVSARDAFMYVVIYEKLRPNSTIVDWIDWWDAVQAVGWIALLGVVLTMVPTLVLTRKYLKV